MQYITLGYGVVEKGYGLNRTARHRDVVGSCIYRAMRLQKATTRSSRLHDISASTFTTIKPSRR